MKRTILLIMCFSLAVFAFRQHEYAEVKVSGISDLDFFTENDINIDRTSIGPGGKLKDGKITVYVTEEEFSLIKSNGYSVKWAPLEISKSGYRNNQAIGDSMLVWQNRHPDICKRIQIGTSVLGRPLWMMKITSDIEVSSPKPKFSYVSTMHGDEVAGIEMCLFFIENLLKGYEAENDTMRFFVENTEIFVMPLMNPDGNEAGGRNNANGIDLNRAFPERIYNERNTTAGKQPEVAAMINFLNENKITLSANFHGGAQVVNYPWDNNENLTNYIYSASPDDEHIVWLAKRYASTNEPILNGGFTDGVTNGNEWYIIIRGLQDWYYNHYSDIDLCIELSDIKWPAYSTIPYYWEHNRESMFWYLSAVHKGIYGIITDASTGAPVNTAAIRIEGINKDHYTGYQHGNYHRVLKAGTYNMTVSAKGYHPQTFTGITVTDDTGKFREAVEINVSLIPKNPYQVLPLAEGMEEYKDPSGWTQPGPNYWIFRKGGTGGSDPSLPRSGDLNANYNGSTGTTARLITPVLDLTYYENVKLSYWYFTVRRNGQTDALRVFHSKNGTAGAWTELSYHNSQVSAWTNNEIVFNNSDLSSEFAIAFDGIDSNGSGINLDDVSITGDFTILATPENVTIAPNGTDIILNWQAVSGATVYKIYRSSDPYAADWGEPIGTSGTGTFTDTDAVSTQSRNFYRITADNVKLF